MASWIRTISLFLIMTVVFPLPQIFAGETDAASFYVFSLGGLSKEQIDSAKAIPGVLSVESVGDRTKISWRHWKPEIPAGDKGQWNEQTLPSIYSLLVLKQKLGNTKWNQGGPAASRSNTVIESKRTSIAFVFNFQDQTSGQVDPMKLHCYCETEERQVLHEMLRDVVGTEVSVKKCGSGYAAVSRAKRGEFVVWQVSKQMFVRIDNLFDPVMVSAYIDRLGSITPQDFVIDQSQWIEDEIRWRIQELDRLYLLRRKQARSECFSYSVLASVQGTFLDVPVVIGRDLKIDCTLEQEWKHLNIVRHWLWANRTNFKYDDERRGFKIKSQDRFDSDHPVELPEDLRGPEALNSEGYSKQIQGTKKPEENQIPPSDPQSNVK